MPTTSSELTPGETPLGVGSEPARILLKVLDAVTTHDGAVSLVPHVASASQSDYFIHVDIQVISNFPEADMAQNRTGIVS